MALVRDRPLFEAGTALVDLSGSKSPLVRAVLRELCAATAGSDGTAPAVGDVVVLVEGLPSGQLRSELAGCSRLLSESDLGLGGGQLLQEALDSSGLELAADARSRLFALATKDPALALGCVEKARLAGLERLSSRQLSLLAGSDAPDLSPAGPWALADAVARRSFSLLPDLVRRIEPVAAWALVGSMLTREAASGPDASRRAWLARWLEADVSVKSAGADQRTALLAAAARLALEMESARGSARGEARAPSDSGAAGG